MSDTKLFTVTLADLGEYTVTVAAATPKEAEGIARSILHDEYSRLPEGLKLTKRETQATASVAENQPVTIFSVTATYSLDFSMEIPAHSRSEAETHAKRLYDACMGPFEFSHDGDRVSLFTAHEIIPQRRVGS